MDAVVLEQSRLSLYICQAPLVAKKGAASFRQVFLLGLENSALQGVGLGKMGRRTGTSKRTNTGQGSIHFPHLEAVLGDRHEEDERDKQGHISGKTSQAEGTTKALRPKMPGKFEEARVEAESSGANGGRCSQHVIRDRRVGFRKGF